MSSINLSTNSYQIKPDSGAVNSPIMSIKEASNLLQVSLDTIRRWEKRG